MDYETRNRLADAVEWVACKVILRAILAVALLTVLAFVVLPSFAFLGGLLFYAKEALMMFIGAIGDVIRFFTT